MKSSLILLILLIITFNTLSQENQITQDPVAGEVLNRVTIKIKTMHTLQAQFELIIEDKKENTRNSSTGNLMLKEKKYKLTSEGSTAYFNGKTMWTYIAANNEVTITEPEMSGTDFISNPVAFLAAYKTDYKYRYVRQTMLHGIPCHEIDLYPKDLDQSYSRIKVYINKTSDLPETISSYGKDGINYSVNLKNMVLNTEIPDATFTFDPAKYKKVQVIDMRGL